MSGGEGGQRGGLSCLFGTSLEGVFPASTRFACIPGSPMGGCSSYSCADLDGIALASFPDLALLLSG